MTILTGGLMLTAGLLTGNRSLTYIGGGLLGLSTLLRVKREVSSTQSK